MDDGEPFTDRDVASGDMVCLLGQTVVRELFGEESPIGKKVRVQNVSLRVVGVLSRKGANMFGVDQDDIFLAPWTTIKNRVSGTSAATTNQSTIAANDSANSTAPVSGTSQRYITPTSLYLPASSTQAPSRFSNVDQILVRADTAEDIPLAIEEMTSLLHERHHLRPGQADDFSIRDMTETSKALGSTTTVMASLLLCVALISLVVGGVGIMNIMLVSVTERTREIGLRMAVGARSKDILRQFLVEAVFLCLLGGAVGICLGELGSFLVHAVLGWPTEFSLPAIIASVAVSAFVGVAFGYYPAWKASRLDPIEALRYE